MSLQAFARVVAAIGFLLVTTISANEALGAGAMAIGSCAAYGYAFDYKVLTEARSAALTKCTGHECRLVADVRHGCGAFAIDGRNVCGAKNFAVAAINREAWRRTGRRCGVRHGCGAFAIDGRNVCGAKAFAVATDARAGGESRHCRTATGTVATIA